MREHHREALDAAVADARSMDGIVGCILGGSVARGRERLDSDVDVILVATAEEYERRRAEWDVWYYREDVCDHPDVYAEGKIVDLEFLWEVAKYGSEPARSAFVDSTVEYAADPVIEAVVEEIPVYPVEEKEDRIETFYAQMEAYRWFVEEAERHDNRYLRSHAASQLALFGGRLLLAHNETLFPFHKWFARELAEVPEKPAGTMELFDRLLEEESVDAAEAYVTAIKEFRDWPVEDLWWPKRFLVDREWQWRDGEPALAEL